MAEEAGREIAVVRRMRMCGSAMGFGVAFGGEGKIGYLTVRCSGTAWELLEGVSDLRDPANGKLRVRIIGGLKVFWCWPMAAVDITYDCWSLSRIGMEELFEY